MSGPDNQRAPVFAPAGVGGVVPPGADTERANAARHRGTLLFLVLVLLTRSLPAATLTVQTNRLGATPEILGYNSGHFFPCSNSADWWRYAGVNGARLFISPGEIEPSDDLGPVGDGVIDQDSFVARRVALRADPLNPVFINWSYFSNRYENADLYPINHIKVNDALRELRKLGVEVLAQITVGQSRFPIVGTDDWAGPWELWQHCYAQAFHLARQFDVRRYQMFNEPNHPNAEGLTIADYLRRLQLASDAFQCALADVNRLYGKSLKPLIFAPVTAGSADGSYPGWGEAVVSNRHRNFLGQWDTNFWLIHRYDYHQYGSAPSGFGSDLASLCAQLADAVAPEPPFPPSISEFNVHTGAEFDARPETLDTPAKYSRFGAILVHLAENSIQELYAFKFSQTEREGVYPVAKNAMHYVDNQHPPYAVGGITRAGEVFRLFAKAAAPGRDRLGFTASGSAANLDTLATSDPVTQCYRLFTVNDASSSVNLSVDFEAWNIASNNLVLVEEVSETCYGGGRMLTNLGAARTVTGTVPTNAVWLFTLPGKAQQAEEILPVAEDATVQDGTNAAVNFGAAPVLLVRNDPANRSGRSAAFLKFRLPTIHRPDIQFALLSLQASTWSASVPVQAHVYGIESSDWSAATLTWSNAPNLRDQHPAGVHITNAVVTGAGSSAHILGQWVVHATNFAERLLDVTWFIRAVTNAEASFLIVQEPRWDVTLPSLEAGDTQPDGIRMISSEGATPATPGPRLRLVRLQDRDDGGLSDEAETTLFGTNPRQADSDGDGVADGIEVLVDHTDPKPVLPLVSNVAVCARATVRGGSYATSDVDEAEAGYVMVKYYPAPFDLARKGYFQFDLTGASPDTQAPATLSLARFSNSGSYQVRLWALNQPYPGMTDGLTWNNALANETNSNSLRTNAPLAATALVDRVVPGGSGTDDFTLAGGPDGWGRFLFDRKIVLVATGLDHPGNNPAGYRVAVNQSSALPTLHFAPAPLVVEQIRVVDEAVCIDFRASEIDPAASFTLLRATNLGVSWFPLTGSITQLAPGRFRATDSLSAVQCFYRVRR